MELIVQIKEEPRITPKTWLRESSHFHYMRKPTDLDDEIAWEKVPAKRPATGTVKYLELIYSDMPVGYQNSIETINGEPPKKQLYGVHTADQVENAAIMLDQKQYSLAAAVYIDGTDHVVLNLVNGSLQAPNNQPK